jgi:hypothetical protein
VICDWGDNGIRGDCIRVRVWGMEGNEFGWMEEAGWMDGWIKGERKGWREETRELFGNPMRQGLKDE